MKKIKLDIAVKRKIAQITIALVTNSHISGFTNGTLYTGSLKNLCVPGLNCYSCPGALGSCPVGALQNVLADPSYKMSFYVVGLLAAFGMLFGRLVCGFMCPFGLFQELLFAPLSFLKKRYVGVRNFFKDKSLPRFLRYFKYLLLLFFVILLPLFAVDAFGYGDPWFCKYICPAGMVMGSLPLLSADSRLRDLLGFIFQIKLSVCVAVLIGSLFSHRFFCKYLCPLGAIYGLFNRFSFYTMRVDKEKCTGCDACAKVCDMRVKPAKTPNSAECIRCGNCMAHCPTKAIRGEWGFGPELYRERA